VHPERFAGDTARVEECGNSYDPHNIARRGAAAGQATVVTVPVVAQETTTPGLGPGELVDVWS